MRIALLHIIALFSAFHTVAQKPMVWLEVEPKEAEVGEVLTIIIKSNVQGEIDIDFPSGFVHGYNISNGMNQEIDYNTGKVITYYHLSQTGAMPKAGTFKFGPAYVKKGNKIYKSNTVSVTIRKENARVTTGNELSAKQLKQPAFALIEKSKATIYEGECVILNAKVYAQFNPSHLEDYQEYTINGALDKHDIGSSTRIMVEEEHIRNFTYYTFEYDKKVVFPTGTGKITVDPFKLLLRRGYESMPLTSSGATIEIKPLPGNVPKDFIGGVGQFNVSRTVQAGTFKQGVVFTLLVEVSGFGNLQNIVEPTLSLPKGFVVYGDPIIKEDFVFGSKGAEGKIVYEYNIQVTKFGQQTLPETRISYFDPNKEKYCTVSTKSDLLVIEKNSKFKPGTDDIASLPQNQLQEEVFPLRRDSGNLSNQTLNFNQKSFWIGVSSPLVLALIFGLWMRKKEENTTTGSQKVAKQNAQIAVQNLFSEAEKALSQRDYTNYYSCIEKGVQRSLSLFLNGDETVILSSSEIFRHLKERDTDPNNITALSNLLSTCEQARYGLGINEEDRDTLIVSAKQITHSIMHS